MAALISTRTRQPFWAVLVIAGLLFAGCDRQFADIAAPSIEIVEPDFSVVQTDDAVDFLVRAESFRDVPRVELNGQPLAFDEEANLWEGRVTLVEGINSFVLSAFDEGDVAKHDTIQALRLPFRVFPSAIELPEGRGGHATTQLFNDQLLVTGGASQGGTVPAAQDEAFLLRSGDTRFETLEGRLQTARTGHSASLLPDGTVLLVGGSTQEIVTEIDQLVGTVERYNPITRRFEAIPTTGAPIRRTFHTTTIRQGTDGVIVHLFGGRGDINYNPPRLGTRQDLRTFLFRNDSLIAISPPLGPFLESIAGQTQTPLNDLAPGEDGRFLVTGTYFLEQENEVPTDDISQLTDDISFIMDFTTPLGILTEPTPPLRVPRIRHAATLLRPGYVIVTGGKQDVQTQGAVTPEIYVESLNTFFVFPQNPAPQQRHGQTATRLSDERILLLGGFTRQGTAAVTAQYFNLTL